MARKKIIPYKPYLTALARKLRNNSTQAEIRLWGELRNKQFLGYDFDRQKPIDNYIVDFFCYELMLAIELDGLTHSFEEVAANDEVRTTKLNELDITVIRFEDAEVMKDMPNVLRTLEAFVHNHKSQG